MIKQILLAGLAGGVIVFLLSAVLNAAHIAEVGLQKLPNEQTILPALRASLPQSGFYFFPGSGDTQNMTAEQKKQNQKEQIERFRKGPTGILIYHLGRDFNFGKLLGIQFLLGLFAALAAAWILAITAGATTYQTRVLIMLLLGVFAFVYLEPQYWNWYGYPAKYTIVRVVEGIASWGIAGLAMAKIIS